MQEKIREKMGGSAHETNHTNNPSNGGKAREKRMESQ